MLIVNNSGSTNVTVTLYEMCQNKVDPYFTWSITRKGTFDNIVFTADDISYANYYWSEFVLTVATSSVGLTSGIIPITDGEWEYVVYEMTDKYDLDINNAVGVVETGIMVCGLTYSEPISVTTNKKIPVYRPN